MDVQNLKRLLAGLGIAGLLAGTTLATGCAAKRAPGSGCGGSGCGGNMMKAPQTTSGSSQPATPQGESK